MDDLKPIKIVVMGQSLGHGLFVSFEARSSVGRDALKREFQKGAQVPVEIENAAVSGTPLLLKYRRRRSWWNETAIKPGRLLASVLEASPEADIVLWSQGETDAEHPDLDLADYEASLRNLFLLLREKYGCLVVCNFIGRRLDGNDETTQQINQIQRKLADELAFVVEGAEQYHVSLFDNLHPNDAGFAKIGALSGQAIIAACLGHEKVYPTVTKVIAKENIVAFHLDGPSDWAMNGQKITAACQITPEDGESQFTVISDRAGTLTPIAMFFDPKTKEVFLVFEDGVLQPSDALMAYVAYGSCAALKQEYLITDCSAPNRPIRRCAFQVTVQSR